MIDEPGDDDALTIRGEIGTSSVPELLRSFVASNETGILTFRHGEDTKTLYIMGGRVVWAASNNPDERLGENLLVHGRIGVRHYVEAGAQIRPGRRLGAILVELAALESEDLLPAVEQQVRETLMDLFSWSRGEYEFRFEELDPETMVTVNMPTEQLILDGVRSTRAWSQVIRGIGGDIQTVFSTTSNSDVLYKLDLSQEEQEILSRVNGRATVEQICDVSYLSNFETCRILWAMSVLGVIKRSGAEDHVVHREGVAERESAMDLEAVVEKYNQMFSRIYQFLRGRMGDEVDSFMDEALEEVSRQYGALFEGVDLKHYGRADYEQMLANVADLTADQRRSVMVTGLNELVFILQLKVRLRQGSQEEAVVSGIIKDGLRRLGTAQ